MNDDNEPRTDLEPLRPAMTARAEAVTAKVMARIQQRRSVPLEVSRILGRFAIPAAIAAAASIVWLATARSAAAPPAHLQRLLLTNRPVQLVEILVAMEGNQ